MLGAIGKREVLAHPLLTVRCFGWRVFLRTICARRDESFLAILAQSDLLKPPSEGVAEWVGRCVELELTAGRIYAVLARRFLRRRTVHAFFAALAEQEKEHAELLEICRTAASQQRWHANPTAGWEAVVPELERRMRNAETSLDAIRDVRSALERVLEIESSEINDVFRNVIAAADSDFVRKMRVFHEAERRHLSFICRHIALLQPPLVPATTVLQQRQA